MDASEDHLGWGDIEDVSLSICRIKTRRVKVAKKVKQRKSKFVSCSCRLKYYNQARTSNNDQDFIPSIPWHAIFVFLDPILIGVLQIEYQNKKESPFDTHPVQMQTFLIAICVYSGLFGIKMHTQVDGGYQAQILSYALLLSGALSSASFLSILLQRQLLWVVLFIWGSILMILARHLLKSSACWMIEMVAKLIWDVGGFAKVVLIFHNKDSASGSGSNSTHSADPVEGIV